MSPRAILLSFRAKSRNLIILYCRDFSISLRSSRNDIKYLYQFISKAFVGVWGESQPPNSFVTFLAKKSKYNVFCFFSCQEKKVYCHLDRSGEVSIRLLSPTKQACTNCTRLFSLTSMKIENLPHWRILLNQNAFLSLARPQRV